MPRPDGRDDAASLAIAQSKLREVDAAAERVAEAIADTGDTLPALLTKARALAASRTELAKEVVDLESRLAADFDDLLDTEYADAVLAVLYKGGSEAAALRAEFNTRLRQAVNAIWLFPYDCAVVEFVGALKPLVVPLAPKGKVAEGGALPLGPKFMQFISAGTENLPVPRYGAKTDVPTV